MFSQMGVPTYGIRVCARVRDDRKELSRTVQELMILRSLTMAISYIALFLVLSFVPKLQEERTLYLIVSLNIFFTFIGMEWLYKGLEQYTYITIRSVLFKFVALVAMFLLIHRQEDYVIYGGISILAASASNIFNFFHAHRYIDWKPLGGYRLKRHLKPVLIFFAMACATTIYTHLDTVMLGFLCTDADVGYYGASVKIKTILVSVVTSLGTVLLPRASYYVRNNEMDKFWAVTRKAINFVFVVASPMAVYFILFARQGILFLSGSAYENAVLPMRIIMPTLLLVGLTNIMGIQVLVPLGQEKKVFYSELGGVITDLILNALLIPRLASAGAAIGTLAAEFVVFLIQYRTVRGKMREAFRGIRGTLIGMALILASAGSFAILSLRLNLIFTLVLSVIVFFGVYGGILLLRKEPMTLEMFRQVTDKCRKLLEK